VLAFPFARPLLERAGVPADKLVDCYPVADIGRFLDRSPNGADVMNVGACIPKKKMEDFIRLAGLLPERHFRIYPIGYQRQRVLDYNRDRGSPVEFSPLIEPQAMPAEYKRHQW